MTVEPTLMRMTTPAPGKPYAVTRPAPDSSESFLAVVGKRPEPTPKSPDDPAPAVETDIMQHQDDAEDGASSDARTSPDTRPDMVPSRTDIPIRAASVTAIPGATQPMTVDGAAKAPDVNGSADPQPDMRTSYTEIRPDLHVGNRRNAHSTLDQGDALMMARAPATGASDAPGAVDADAPPRNADATERPGRSTLSGQPRATSLASMTTPDSAPDGRPAEPPAMDDIVRLRGAGRADGTVTLSSAMSGPSHAYGQVGIDDAPATVTATVTATLTATVSATVTATLTAGHLQSSTFVGNMPVIPWTGSHRSLAEVPADADTSGAFRVASVPAATPIARPSQILADARPNDPAAMPAIGSLDVATGSAIARDADTAILQVSGRPADSPVQLPATSPAGTTPGVPHQIAQAARALSTGPVDILLAPEELGRVRLRLSLSDTGMTVLIVADRDDTMALLRRHVDVLTQALRELDLGTLDIAFGESQSRDGERHPSGKTPQSTAFGNPTAITELTFQPPPRRLGDRLDLRF